MIKRWINFMDDFLIENMVKESYIYFSPRLKDVLHRIGSNDISQSLLDVEGKNIEPDIQYFPPFKFLPSISFQILENLETAKCRKIGDPNGFCGVWCVWWVYQRMLNISNDKLNVSNVANEIIKFIKLDNQSFKTIIRNFSKKITQIRDGYLKKYSLDINDWVVSNYTPDTLDKLEKDIFKSIGF